MRLLLSWGITSVYQNYNFSYIISRYFYLDNRRSLYHVAWPALLTMSTFREYLIVLNITNGKSVAALRALYIEISISFRSSADVCFLSLFQVKINNLVGPASDIGFFQEIYYFTLVLIKNSNIL